MKQIGEIILVNFPLAIAEGKRGKLPPIGSIVNTDSGLLGIVVSHSIDSKIPGRVPVAYGRSTEELEKVQPQVFSLMKWMFQLVIFGSKKKNKIEISLPDKSVDIHSLVYEESMETVEKLIRSKAFFEFVFGADPNLFPQRNETVLRLLRDYFQNTAKEEVEKEYVEIFSNIAHILHGDYASLKKLMDGVKI